jgi:O-acetyl-ADP-ribose deacetylase (regulator of RNase III)
VRNAVRLARERNLRSLAFPLIGAGTGGASEDKVLAWMQNELSQLDFDGEIRIVRFNAS